MSGRFLHVDGVRLYYTEQGQGDPVLLLHGYLLSHRHWDAVAPKLARHFMVFAPDLPGFGESECSTTYSYSIDGMAATIGRLMDRLGVARAAVVGHSMGGTVALALAAANPERISRLVLVAPAIYPFPMPLEGRLGLLPVVGRTAFMRLFTRPVFRNLLRRLLYADPALLSEEVLQRCWEHFNGPGARRAAYRLLHTMARLEPFQHVPRRIECPTLLLWGERDRMVPPAHGRRLQGELRRSRLVMFPGVGHTPMEEAPRRFVELAVPFLRGEEDP